MLTFGEVMLKTKILLAFHGGLARIIIALELEPVSGEGVDRVLTTLTPVLKAIGKRLRTRLVAKSSRDGFARFAGRVSTRTVV